MQLLDEFRERYKVIYKVNTIYNKETLGNNIERLSITKSTKRPYSLLN